MIIYDDGMNHDDNVHVAMVNEFLFDVMERVNDFLCHDMIGGQRMINDCSS